MLHDNTGRDGLRGPRVRARVRPRACGWSFWPAVGHYGDTIILASLGVACFANFARNRTLHCGLSGPIFVLGALVAAAVEAGVWDLDLRVIWGILLAAVAGALLIERRTVGRRPSASNADARA